MLPLATMAYFLNQTRDNLANCLPAKVKCVEMIGMLDSPETNQMKSIRRRPVAEQRVAVVFVAVDVFEAVADVLEAAAAAVVAAAFVVEEEPSSSSGEEVHSDQVQLQVPRLVAKRPKQTSQILSILENNRSIHEPAVDEAHTGAFQDVLVAVASVDEEDKADSLDEVRN